MINGFHMNPLWYLATIPIGVSLTSAGLAGLYANNFMTIVLILNIVLLCILFYLYINNIIGLLDMIFLFVIMFFFISVLFSLVNIILIPLAMGLSFAFHK